MVKEDLLEQLGRRLEAYIEDYKRAERLGNKRIMIDRMYSAYEVSRIIGLIDTSAQEESVEKLRDNGL